MDVQDWAFIYLLAFVVLAYGLLLSEETPTHIWALPAIIQINRTKDSILSKIIDTVIDRLINRVIDRVIDNISTQQTRTT